MTKRRWGGVAAISGACALVGLVAFLVAPRPHTPPSLPVSAPSVTPSTTPVTASPRAAVPASPVRPVRLTIQSLGIDSAAMQAEGLCTSNSPNADPACSGGTAANPELQTPPLSGPDARDVGWWTGGLQAGRPQVFVAHVNSAALGNLTFWNLTTIKTGALIVVQPGNQTFRVYATQEVGKAIGVFPTARVYGTTTSPELRLITCGGAFDSSTGHYLDNFIVYAARA